MNLHDHLPTNKTVRQGSCYLATQTWQWSSLACVSQAWTSNARLHFTVTTQFWDSVPAWDSCLLPLYSTHWLEQLSRCCASPKLTRPQSKVLPICIIFISYRTITLCDGWADFLGCLNQIHCFNVRAYTMVISEAKHCHFSSFIRLADCHLAISLGWPILFYRLWANMLACWTKVPDCGLDERFWQKWRH